MGERYKSLAKDTILFGISSFSSKILIFLLLPIYTNVLTTSEYGVTDVIVNLVNLLYPLLTLSIVEAVLRFAFAKEIQKNELLTSSLAFIFLGIVLLVILTPFSKMPGQMMYDNWGYFIALFAGYSLQNLFASYCRGSNRSRIFALQGIVQTISLLLFNLFFLIVLNLGKNGYLLATICAYGSAVIFMIFVGKLYEDLFPLKINVILIRDMLGYSIPLVPAMMAWWINNSADKYTIIALVGMGASGVYAVAHKIPTILTTVSDIFNQAFLISAVNNIESDDSLIYFKNVSRYYLIVNYFVCSILIMFSEFMAEILFSDEYFDGWIYVPILLVAAVFSSLSAYIASFFRTTKTTQVLFKSTVIGAIINILFNVILIKLIGTIGAAYSTAISFGVVFFIRYHSLRNIIQLEYMTKKNIIAGILIIMQAILFSFDLSKYVISTIVFFILIWIYYKDIKSIYKMLREKLLKSK